MGGDLSKRIWFTLGALLVYRLGTHVPIPGIVPGGHLFPCSIPGIHYIYCSPGPFGLPRLFDALTGSGFGRTSIFAFSVLPYLAASALMLLAAAVWPVLAALEKHGEVGRKRLYQYTRYLTVLLSALQAYFLAVVLEQYASGNTDFPLVRDPGTVFRLTTVLTLTAGTLFVTWLADQITRRGIGNGIGLILFSGLAVHLRSDIGTILELGRTRALSVETIIGYFMLMTVAVAAILSMERARRRPKLLDGEQPIDPGLPDGRSRDLLLRVNAAGVAPPVLAAALTIMPLTLAGFWPVEPAWADKPLAFLGRYEPSYLLLYAFLIVVFTILCARRSSGPASNGTKRETQSGVTSDAKTAAHLKRLQARLMTVAATYLVVISLIPELLNTLCYIPFKMGGVGLLILVWVAWDVIGSIRSHRQPPSGGPPDDTSGAVGALAVVGRQASAVASENQKGSTAEPQ